MRVFLILFFVLLVNNVYALTLLEDENKKLELYGNFLFYTGYGHGEAPAGVDLEAGRNTSDSMLYGVQDNSNLILVILNHMLSLVLKKKHYYLKAVTV